MYELYWDAGTLAMAPHIALEEVGATYHLHHVAMDDDAQQRPEFIRLNPAGTLPVLVHDGVVLTETAAILQYIAALHPEAGLLPTPGTPAYGQTLRWLMFAVTTLQTAGRRMFYSERFSTDPSHADAIQQRAEEHLYAGWRIVDEHALASGPFINGEQYSIADIHLVLLSTWHTDAAQLRSEFPRVGRLFDAARARPATQRVLEQHDVE